MRGRAAAVLALAACLLPAGGRAGGQATAQQPQQPQQPYTVETEVNVVSVTAVVFDKSGHVVHGLGRSDVELLEDGVAQEVSYFREASSQGDP
ncbi:MAG TPA: hypothetical protein VEQ10_00100, partial [Vicinamibacteria bacterium]|nr:hypothetical protein [Vicinamibacteria bacterium]